jgi:hypothetical protein
VAGERHRSGIYALCPLSILKLIISHQLTELPDGTEIVYSFWNGMPHLTQVQILKLSASCRTVSKLAVFRDDKWSSPDQGFITFIASHSNLISFSLRIPVHAFFFT